MKKYIFCIGFTGIVGFTSAQNSAGVKPEITVFKKQNPDYKEQKQPEQTLTTEKKQNPENIPGNEEQPQPALITNEKKENTAKPK
jgi:hypothetical protein